MRVEIKSGVKKTKYKWLNKTKPSEKGESNSMTSEQTTKGKEKRGEGHKKKTQIPLPATVERFENGKKSHPRKP